MRRTDGRRRVPEGMKVIPLLLLILAFILVIQSVTLNESKVSGDPIEVYDYLDQVMYFQPVEYSMAAGLSNGNISYVEIVGTGDHNSTSTDLAEVVKRAHKENVTQIALLHNHPNHATFASENDLRVWKEYTNYIVKNNVTVLDAVVLGSFTVIYRMSGDSISSSSAGQWERVQGGGIDSKKTEAMKAVINEKRRRKKTSPTSMLSVSWNNVAEQGFYRTDAPVNAGTGSVGSSADEKRGFVGVISHATE